MKHVRFSYSLLCHSQLLNPTKSSSNCVQILFTTQDWDAVEKIKTSGLTCSKNNARKELKVKG